jgi:hypothetical protein
LHHPKSEGILGAKAENAQEWRRWNKGKRLKKKGNVRRKRTGWKLQEEQ